MTSPHQATARSRCTHCRSPNSVRRPTGEDVNIVDAASLREVVHNLLGTGSPGPAPTRELPLTAGAQIKMHASASQVVLDVINASGQEGLATSLEKAFGTGQFAEGVASTAESAIAI